MAVEIKEFKNPIILENGTSINEFSIDGTLAGNSDNAVPTEQAVKTYVDSAGNPTLLTLPANNIDFSHDGGQKKVMTGNTTFTISNPVYNKEILFELSGNFTPTFPSEVKNVFGTYDGSATMNYYYIRCVGTVAQGGSLKYISRIYQEDATYGYVRTS